MTDTNKCNPRLTVYNNQGLNIKRGYNGINNEIVWYFSDGTTNTFLNLGELNTLIDVLIKSKKFSVEVTNTSEEMS